MSSAYPSEETKEVSELYVGNLSRTVTDSELYTFFSSKGLSIRYARVIKRPGTDVNYGICVFCNHSEGRRSW